MAKSTPRKMAVFTKQLYDAIDNEEIAEVERALNLLPNPSLILQERMTPHCDMTPLHLAVGLNAIGIAELLLQNGSDPNCLNCVEKTTPLHLAVMYNYEDLVNLLISAGGNPYLFDGENASCFDLIKNDSELSHLLELIQVSPNSSTSTATTVVMAKKPSCATSVHQITAAPSISMYSNPFEQWKSPESEEKSNFKVPAAVQTKNETQNERGISDESFVTCCQNDGSTLSPPFFPNYSRRPVRQSMKFFFEERKERRKTQRLQVETVEKQVQELSDNFAYLMTEDESTATSRTTTSVSSYSPTCSETTSIPSLPSSETEETTTSCSRSCISPSESEETTSKAVPTATISPRTVTPNRPPTPSTIRKRQPQPQRLNAVPKTTSKVKNGVPTIGRSLSLRFPLSAAAGPNTKAISTAISTRKRILNPILKESKAINSKSTEDVNNIKSNTATTMAATAVKATTPASVFIPFPAILNDPLANFTIELRGALSNLDLVNLWGNHKIEFVQAVGATPTKRTTKSYYNYVLLDPKIIKRSNFSGNYLKSDIIKNSDKFLQFLKAIFYIGKGCGNRPLQHLVDAKTKLQNHKKLIESEKLDRIVQIWKSGQGIILHSIFHHSVEKEANVNEAAMLDALGINGHNNTELTNLKKGSYVGTPAAQWTQKIKNQFGSFLLYKCFCSFVVSGDGKVFYPNDV